MLSKKEVEFLIDIAKFSFIETVSIYNPISLVWPFVTSWTAARQASLSITSSQSLLKLMSVESVMPPTISSSVVPFSCLQSFLTSGSFLMSWLFTSGGQSIWASASESVLTMNIQDWFLLGLTLWSLYKGPSTVFSNTTIQKYQFFRAQSSLWSSSNIHTWLLEKPQLWLYGCLMAKWCLCFLIHCLVLS